MKRKNRIKKQKGEAELHLKLNEVYADYLDLNSSTQIFFGGSSSGKSFFLAQRCIYHILQGKNYLITRKVDLTLRDSTFKEIKKAINRLPFEIARDFKINESSMVITYLPNKKQIVFKGLDDVQKLKSITPLDGNFNFCWIEEATEIMEEDLIQLRIRLRGSDEEEGVEESKKIIILSFNPIFKTHWIFKEFFGDWLDSDTLYNTSDLFILKTTYKDNSFLTKDDIGQLLKIKDEYHRKVYVSGEWGTLSEVIFKNWRVEDLTSLIPVFDNLRNGYDFGYSPAPSALWRSHLDEKRKIIYLIAELYMYGIQNDEAVRRVEEIIHTERLVCDSEAPKDIDDFKIKGLRSVPARKGPGSIEYGLKWMQGYTIVIHCACQNAINEFTLLRRAKDKNGNTLEKIVGAHHLIDAGRYAHQDDMEVISNSMPEVMTRNPRQSQGLLKGYNTQSSKQSIVKGYG